MARIAVHVIESPSPTDFLDNWREGEALSTALVHTNVTTALYTAVDIGVFYEALRRVAESIQDSEDAGEGLVHVLQLSMHGSESGVVLTNGAVLDWHELGIALDIIGDAVGSGLLLAMSTCHGYAAIKIADRKKKAPVYAIIGPTREIHAKDAVTAFVALYYRLQRPDGKVVDAVRIMNEVLEESLFDCTTAAAAAERYSTARLMADDDFWDRFLKAELPNRPEAAALVEAVRHPKAE